MCYHIKCEGVTEEERSGWYQDMSPEQLEE